MKKNTILYLLFTLLSSVSYAQIQLESDLDKIKNTPFETEVPKAPNDFKFEKPITHNKILFVPTVEFKKTIYVDKIKGKDSNSGLSEEDAIQTLSRVNEIGIEFGTRVLLKGGLTYTGTLELLDMNSSVKAKDMIQISSYGGQKATIDFKGYPAGVWIQNTSNVIISDLKFTGNGGPNDNDFMIRDGEKNSKQRYAVRILSTSTSKNSLVENIEINNVDIYDVFLINPIKESRACRQWDMNDTAGWGWGVFGEVLNKGKGIRNIMVKKVIVENVSQMGIRFKGQGSILGGEPHNVSNLIIDSCVVYQAGGPGMQFNRCNHSHMRNCRITESGNRNDNRKWGRGSGMWTWGVNHFLLDKNIFEGAQGIADCCGAHIDFNCTNVVIQYCLSRYNAGGFIEILGKNSNCSYRYNVSVNDGWRNKNDEKQKFWGSLGTPGCIVTINGHNNDKKYVGPYNTYINNNTIISSIEGNKPYTNPNVFNISTSNRGLVIMNNIFWFDHPTNAGWSMHRWKDGAAYDAAFDFKISDGQKAKGKADAKLGGSYPANVRDMNEKELAELGLVMRNNLYLRFNPDGKDKFSTVKDALPQGYWDEKALGGNPKFVNEKGSSPQDFIPTDAAVIYRGEKIPHLKSDQTDYGIFFGGLNLTKDYFGIILDKEIIGAIAPKE